MSDGTVVCVLCRRDWPRKDSKCFTLTDEEKKCLPSVEVLDEYVYCGPCWKVLSDPKRGPALLQGLTEGGLKQLGVNGAEEYANKFGKWLETKAKG
jgi:hypothetical protein